MNEDFKETLHASPGQSLGESSERSQNHGLEDGQDPLIGQVINERWLILERLGEGGMSVVYKARHLVMNKIVAIKAIRADFVSNARLVQRFQQEAQTAGALNHPNLMAIQDCLVTRDGRAFLIMDFVKGESLADLIARCRRLSSMQSARIFLQAADALSYAHSKRVLHRDLKPGNIMIEKVDNPDGSVEGCQKVNICIVDFGIAKLLAGEEGEQVDLTRTGEVFGSPPYMSPEQIDGKIVDERSDIYSLGCVMYETLTGRSAFRGNTVVETIMKNSSEIPKSFSEVLGPQVVRDDTLLRRLESVTMKALEKRPQDRFQTMKDLSRAIEKAATTSGGWARDEFKGNLRRHQLLFKREFVFTKLTLIVLVVTFLLSGNVVFAIWGWSKTQSYLVDVGMISEPLKRKLNPLPENVIQTEGVTYSILGREEAKGTDFDQIAKPAQILGKLYSETGRPDKARDMYLKAIDNWIKVAPNVIHVAEIEADLCYNYYVLGDIAKARKTALDAIERLKAAAPKESPLAVMANFVLAETYMSDGAKFVEKANAKTEELRAAQKKGASAEQQVGVYAVVDGYKEQAKTAFREGAKYFAIAYKLLESRPNEQLAGKITLRAGDAYFMAAVVSSFTNSGDMASAKRCYAAATKAFKDNPEVVAQCYFHIGHLELMQSRWEAANEAFEQALKFANQTSPRKSSLICTIKREYLESLWNTDPFRSILTRYSMLQDLGQ